MTALTLAKLDETAKAGSTMFLKIGIVTYQFWPTTSGKMLYGKIGAHIMPYIEALDVDEAVQFLLNFGGATVYFGKKVQARGKLFRFLGEDAANTLLRKFEGYDYMRIPTAHKFIARFMRANGTSVGDIARIMHRTDVTVRTLLQPDKELYQLA